MPLQLINLRTPLLRILHYEIEGELWTHLNLYFLIYLAPSVSALDTSSLFEILFYPLEIEV